MSTLLLWTIEFFLYRTMWNSLSHRNQNTSRFRNVFNAWIGSRWSWAKKVTLSKEEKLSIFFGTAMAMMNLNRLDFISMEIQSWSNNNPATIAGLFLKATEDLEVFPRCVRTDCGTENGLLAAAQCYFNRDHDHKSHLYGSSNHNQRIESWWLQFRKLKFYHRFF